MKTLLLGQRRLDAARSGTLQLQAFSCIRAAEADPEASDADADADSTEAGPAAARRVIMSTAAVDRYGDVISQEGWDLTNFRANPVLMPAHNYGVHPVGTVSDVSVSERPGGKALVGTLNFWMSDPSGAGTQAAQAYHDGILRGVSVGFRPLSWRPRSELAEDHPAHGARGFWIERAELLELSTAPIPVNQEALALQRALGSSSKLSEAPELEPELEGLIRSILVDLLVADTATRKALRRSLQALLLSEPTKHTTSSTDSAERIADWITS